MAKKYSFADERIRRVMLIGCSKQKSVRADGVKHPVAVRQFYNSPLFKKRVQLADQLGLSFYILSAKHGLLLPDRQIRYYDQEMGDLNKVNRAAWAPGVVVQWLEQLCDDDDPKEWTMEFHCGELYAHPLSSLLEIAGAKVEFPVAGLEIGDQLKWCNEKLAKVAEVIK